MILKTQHSMLVSIDSLDYAKGKLDARIGNEDPESEEMKELVSSIQTFGIQHPLDIRPKSGGRYDVIAGNRRLTAAKILKLDYVPAKILNEYTPTKALVWAFNDNRARKNYNQLEAAKILLRCYTSIGLESKAAIMKVKHMYNLKINHPEEYAKAKIASRGTKQYSTTGGTGRRGDVTEPTQEFLEIFFDVGIAPNTQYQLLQIVTQIPDSAFEILEQNPKLSLHKAVALTHSKLKDYPTVVKEALAEQIINPKMNDTEARHLVNQTIADLEAGRTTVTDDGNIDYGYGSGKGNRSNPNENIDSKQELEKTFDAEILDITSLLMKTIGRILHIQIPRGEIRYTPELYKPALQEFEKNLITLRKNDKLFCAEQAAIMGRICKSIVDSVK